MRLACACAFAVAVAVAAVAAAAAAPAAPRANYPFPPASALEKAQTRPLVDVTLAALRAGDFGKICGLISHRWLTAEFGSRARCRHLAAAHPTRPCKSCSYRVTGVVRLYKTDADRRLKRQTVGWLFAVKGDPHFRGASELDLDFRRDLGRWRLDNMTAAGSGS